MPAKIFVASILLIGLAFLVVPAARYLIWGPEYDIDPVTVDDGPDMGNARELEIVRLLGKDAISAILEPEFVTATEAERWMSEAEGVLGVSVGGEHKAYAVSMLSRHEIVNDVVGGKPIAVTW